MSGNDQIFGKYNILDIIIRTPTVAPMLRLMWMRDIAPEETSKGRLNLKIVISRGENNYQLIG
jgi:hypothetical protein